MDVGVGDLHLFNKLDAQGQIVGNLDLDPLLQVGRGSIQLEVCLYVWVTCWWEFSLCPCIFGWTICAFGFSWCFLHYCCGMSCLDRLLRVFGCVILLLCSNFCGNVPHLGEGGQLGLHLGREDEPVADLRGHQHVGDPDDLVPEAVDADAEDLPGELVDVDVHGSQAPQPVAQGLEAQDPPRGDVPCAPGPDLVDPVHHDHMGACEDAE